MCCLSLLFSFCVVWFLFEVDEERMLFLTFQSCVVFLYVSVSVLLESCLKWTKKEIFHEWYSVVDWIDIIELFSEYTVVSVACIVAFFFFFCVPQLYLWGSPFLVRFWRMWPFLNPTIEVVTFCLHGWCMLGVFLLPAFIHLGHECQDLLSLCDGLHVCTD